MSEESKGLVCPLTGCPIKKILITTLAAFVVTYGFDALYHGVLLKDAYEATASMWRPEADMKSMMGFCLGYHLVFSFAVAALYCYFAKHTECCGACPGKGIRFGLLLGLILGVTHFSTYMWLPIPLDLAIKWLAGGVIWGVLVGYVLALVCSKCGGCKKA